MIRKAQERLFTILERPDRRDPASRLVAGFLIVLVILNVVGMMLESEPSLAHWRGPLHLLELFAVGMFTLEYLLRLWVAVLDRRFRDPVRGRVQCALRFFSLVDLLSIAPFYVAWFGGDDQLTSMIHFLWIAKLGRHSRSLRLVADVFRAQCRELMAAGFVLLVLLLLASCAIYVVEHETQPEVFPSIPAAIWWSTVTITTVGYGDAVPVTTAGKVVGALVALVGVLTIALPTSILGTGFLAVTRTRATVVTCPHCRQAIHPPLQPPLE